MDLSNVKAARTTSSMFQSSCKRRKAFAIRPSTRRHVVVVSAVFSRSLTELSTDESMGPIEFTIALVPAHAQKQRHVQPTITTRNTARQQETPTPARLSISACKPAGRNKQASHLPPAATMAPRGLLLLLLLAAVAAASSPSVLLATHEPEQPSRKLPAAQPTVHDDAADHPGACSGQLIIPSHMIRGTAVPAAGPPGIYDITVVLRATRRRGQYYVVPCLPGSVVTGQDGEEHREKAVTILMTGLVINVVCFIFLFCFEMMMTGLRGDGGDEAYSGGNGAVQMKPVIVELAHANAVKVKQPRGDN
ncbi:unnamed protein product [Urochloa humidicola]